MKSGLKDAAEYQADIVIIGSGGGLAAALTAAEAGARVILLEKIGTLGGYTKLANGFMACEGPLQKRMNISVTTAEVFRNFMRWAHCRRVDPRVVRAYFDQTGETIDWLEKKGVEFELVTPPNILPIVHLPIGMAEAVQNALIKGCEKLGVTALLHTSGRKILTGKEGQVTGVIAVKDKKEFRIDAKCVIIATGGFGDNAELLKKYCPDYYDGMPLDLWPHHSAHSGDGLLMAKEIGAALAESVPNYHMGPYYHPFMYPWQGLAYIAMNNKTIWLNKRGRRFIDEGGSFGTDVNGNAILMQPDKIMYTVFDDEIRRNVEEGASGEIVQGRARHSKAGGGTIIADGTFPGLAKDLQKEAGKSKSSRVKIADSWDEIAAWMGAKPEVLKAEINEYNTFCEKGCDAVFTKDKEYLKPLRKPPYYAMKCEVRVGETLGGIKVSERMEILDSEAEIIPGAYAAGVIADGFEPEDYNREIPGCALGFAINSGRIAGRNAAKFVMKTE